MNKFPHTLLHICGLMPIRSYIELLGESAYLKGSVWRGKYWIVNTCRAERAYIYPKNLSCTMENI